jgi:hypothetical protein
MRTDVAKFLGMARGDPYWGIGRHFEAETYPGRFINGSPKRTENSGLCKTVAAILVGSLQVCCVREYLLKLRPSLGIIHIFSAMEGSKPKNEKSN